MIGRYTLDKYYRREFKFQPHSVLEKGSSWKFSSTYAKNWYTQDFDDAAWSSGSYFPVANMDVITRYYRKTVSFGDLTGFASFELAVNTNYGIAMYVNGQEIYRHNLAADASSTTPVEEAEAEASYHRAFANRHLLGESAMLAVEIHFPADHAPIVDPFNAFVNLVYGNSYRVFDGSVSGDHLSDYWDELGANLWDNQINNKWYNKGFPAENIFTFNSNRAEYVNYYTITTGNQDTGRLPTQWKLEGSNDGENWDLLDAQSGISWSGYGHTQYFPIPQVAKGYRSFKWTIQASGMNEAETSDVSLYAMDLEVAPMEISYGRTFVFYPGQSVSIYPVAKGFSSWTVTPDLPSGLSINMVSGLISGTVPSAVDLGLKTYTVSATLAGVEEPLTGELSINFHTCLGNGYRRVKIDAVNGNRRARQSYDIVANGEVVE